MIEGFIPRGARVVIDEDGLSERERENVYHHFDGDWIWGYPLVLRENYYHDGNFVDVRVTSPQGEEYNTSFYPNHVKLFQTEEEIKQELLDIKEEVLGR